MATCHLTIIGLVQGVGYRAWLSGQAQKAGVNGWVRNRTDLSVEALLEGPSDVIERLIRSCYQGPPSSKVESVLVAASDEGVAAGFSVLPTL